ncbi:MAG: hypothetical protein ACSLFO_12725 [Acidimicrobiales bacterium]
MRRFAVALPVAVGALCGGYAVVYLVRWEWNRAIIAGICFLAVEVIVVGVLILERLRRIEARLDDAQRDHARMAPVPDAIDPTDPALEALRATTPPPPDRFAWIRDSSGSMQVFLPVLLGAGVLASAAAWLVERVARATVSPALERRLALRLRALALPPGGLLGPSGMPVPAGRRSDWKGPVAGVVAALALVAGGIAGIDRLGDLTQTRPDVMQSGVQTVVDVTLRGALADRHPERVVDHLWSVCTSPDVFRSRQLPPPAVAHGADGAVRIVVDTDIGTHGVARLRGCLNDATIDKVQATVIGVHVG